MPTRAAPDVIEHLAGIEEGSPAATLRRQKPDLVAFAQGSYEALLEPEDPGGVSLIERHAIGYRVGLLTGFPAVADWHRDRLQQLGVDDDLLAAIAEFPEHEGLDRRLATLLAHTDRVTTAPGQAEAAHIEELHAAGLTPRDIVTVGQLIGFLAYQIRAIAVARAFGGAS